MSNTTTTFTTLSVEDVCNYLRLTELTEDDKKLLRTIIQSAKDYVLKYTGLTEEQADSKNDLVIAVYVLCQDMFDNRAYYVNTSNVNKVVENILGLHSINLL